LFTFDLNKQIDIRTINVFYMEDDGGSVLTNAVSREIKEAIERVVRHLQTTHAISARKVSGYYLCKCVSSLTF
jgi:hypothetical protein